MFFYANIFLIGFIYDIFLLEERGIEHPWCYYEDKLKNGEPIEIWRDGKLSFLLWIVVIYKV